MRTARATLQTVVVAILLLGAASWASAREDDEVAEEPAAPVQGQGTQRKTLAERIPSVTHRAFTKAGRVELFPALGLSLSDPFYRYVIPSAGIHYYFTESISAGAAVSYYAGVSTPVNVAGGTALAAPTFNKPNYAAQLELAWSPLYGKISWLAESVMHFDTYLIAGGGVIGPQTGSTIVTGSVGLGQHYFFNDWIALRAEVREQFYKMARSSSTASSLQTLLSVSIGLCFYFPQETDDQEE